MRILLITGGWSAERQVALNGAACLQVALECLGHTVEFFDLCSFEELPAATKRNDFAFINLHGAPGEDGLVQALLERLDFPYQGSSAAGSILALNKAVAKALFIEAGLPVAPSVLLAKKPSVDWLPTIPFPLFIKDNIGGSTLNVEYVVQPQELPAALDRLFLSASSLLVEVAVHGFEITCGVIGQVTAGEEVAKALPPILIKANNASGLFDYESKYTPGGAEEVCPAPIPDSLTATIQDLAVRAHTVLGLSGYSRTDFIVQEKEGSFEPIILETNTLPGMTKTSLIPQELAAIGVSYKEMVRLLIEVAMVRFSKSRVR